MHRTAKAAPREWPGTEGNPAGDKGGKEGGGGKED